MIFLAEAVNLDPALTGGLIAGIFALIAAFLIIAFIVGIGVYIYISLAFSAIAKKARYASPGIAWIPVVGPLLITSSIAKMHWWPILLLLGFWIPVIGGLIMLALTVFSIIWLWKTKTEKTTSPRFIFAKMKMSTRASKIIRMTRLLSLQTSYSASLLLIRRQNIQLTTK